jgi:hypothetical protein
MIVDGQYSVSRGWSSEWFIHVASNLPLLYLFPPFNLPRYHMSLAIDLRRHFEKVVSLYMHIQ